MNNLKQEELRKYILGEDLTKVFPILIYQIILAEARSEMIKESSQKLKKTFMDTVNSYFTEQSFIKLHMLQLDLISKLFMLLEDYLSYSYYLRFNKKDLPENILSPTMGLPQKEINNLKDLDKAGISEYFLLSNLNKLPLPDNDKKFVEEVLNVLFVESQQRINEIAKFFKNYYKVYIRYKHILSAFIGTYSVEENKKIPRIFMRDQIENKKQNVKKYYTHILPSNIETLEYYEKLNDHISKMFKLLLACHVHSIQNCGKPFLISDGYFLPSDRKRAVDENC